MRRTLVIAMALAIGCKGDAKKSAVGKDGSADPWSQKATVSVVDNDDGDGLAALGVNLPDTLRNVFENLKKPGPYEAPEKGSAANASAPHWAIIEFSGGLSEVEEYSWTGGDAGEPVRARAGFLRSLAKRKNLSGVIVRLDGFAGSLTDTLELRSSLAALRSGGVPVHCHAHGIAGAGYLLMSACEKLGLSPLGDLAITGPAAVPIHVRPLLDRLGIRADFVHIGAYKGAAEPLTRDAPSKEMNETLGAILDRQYLTMVEVIADGRGIAADGVRRLIDIGVFTSEQALAAKLIDSVNSFEEFRSAVAGDNWIAIDDDDSPQGLQQMVKLMQFIGAVPTARPTAPHVALVHAVGGIVDGGGDGLLGARTEIAAGTLVPALQVLASDDAVKAVVLRVDSPGGSAQASELIWKAVGEIAAKKPVIVSMSDVAASGGYYISAGATKIFALPETLTGSIGVVGGKLALAGALAKVGVRAYPMGRGKRATMMASFAAWTADEKSVIEAMMRSVYDVFKARVSDGRKLTPERVEAIAQGRVWTGADAKVNGLVDELGGLDAALAEAHKLAGLPPETELEVYPPTPTLRDIAVSFGAASVGDLAAHVGGWRATAAHAIDALPKGVQDSAHALLRAIDSFSKTHIQTRALLPLVRI